MTSDSNRHDTLTKLRETLPRLAEQAIELNATTVADMIEMALVQVDEELSAERQLRQKIRPVDDSKPG